MAPGMAPSYGSPMNAACHAPMMMPSLAPGGYSGMMGGPPPPVSSAPVSSMAYASAAPQQQQVQQVSDYIQPEQVMRHMNRKKC